MPHEHIRLCLNASKQWLRCSIPISSCSGAKVTVLQRRFLCIFCGEGELAGLGWAYDVVELVEDVERDDVVPRVARDGNRFIDELGGGGAWDARYTDCSSPLDVNVQEIDAAACVGTNSYLAPPTPDPSPGMTGPGISMSHYRSCRWRLRFEVRGRVVRGLLSQRGQGEGSGDKQ